MLLAFDLDRTIVTDDYTLPPRIAGAIERARRAGHPVTVLTGRPHAAARPFLDQLEVRGPYSVNHGALVIGADGAVLRQRKLPPQAVHAMIDRFKDDDAIEFSVIDDDVLYVRDPSDPRWAWAHTLNRRVERFVASSVRGADKLVFASDELELRHSAAIETEIRRDHPDVTTYLWGDGYLEITESEADKGVALELIARVLEIPQRDVIAFGDGLNDVAMLAWAGHSVAVGPHVHPDALAHADEHIASPEEGGVAAWLEQRIDGVKLAS